MICAQCGITFPVPPGRGQGRRKFCTEVCGAASTNDLKNHRYATDPDYRERAKYRNMAYMKRGNGASVTYMINLRKRMALRDPLYQEDAHA